MYMINSQENPNYADLLNTQQLSQVNHTPRFRRYLYTGYSQRIPCFSEYWSVFQSVMNTYQTWLRKPCQMSIRKALPDFTTKALPNFNTKALPNFQYESPFKIFCQIFNTKALSENHDRAFEFRKQ